MIFACVMGNGFVVAQTVALIADCGTCPAPHQRFIRKAFGMHRDDRPASLNKKALLFTGLRGADGDRTRDLRRDRPAF